MATPTSAALTLICGLVPSAAEDCVLVLLVEGFVVDIDVADAVALLTTASNSSSELAASQHIF